MGLQKHWLGFNKSLRTNNTVKGQRTINFAVRGQQSLTIKKRTELFFSFSKFLFTNNPGMCLCLSLKNPESFKGNEHHQSKSRHLQRMRQYVRRFVVLFFDLLPSSFYKIPKANFPSCFKP